uniref:class I SAM-dependent methyltransferase n=1 Tax=Candidatus Electronema sp. TaxID=2698783 RepID=UPI0040567759
MAAWLNSLLQHPLTKGLAVDDPETTRRRRAILRSKPFLRCLYREWYQLIAQALPHGEGLVVEFGSGAGFMKDCIPEVLTTEVQEGLEGIDIVLTQGGPLPFPDASVKALVMTDVLHHINEPRRFFAEATRVVRPNGGVLLMIEPWVTPWSRFIYTHLHSEPFQPESPNWEFPGQGPLSGANGALPWILFQRDRPQFEQEFPQWTITHVQPLMPLAYLLSGGLSLRSFAPAWLYGLCRWLEQASPYLERKNAMFSFCVLTHEP